MRRYTYITENGVIESKDAVSFENSNIISVVPIYEEIQDKLLQKAWEFIYPYFDNPAFVQITDWRHSFAPEHPIQKLIDAVQKWKDAVMFEYLFNKKIALWNDQPFDWDYTFIGHAPINFTALFLEANPQYKPNGYTTPDVSTYSPGTR